MTQLIICPRSGTSYAITDKLGIQQPAQQVHTLFTGKHLDDTLRRVNNDTHGTPLTTLVSSLLAYMTTTKLIKNTSTEELAVLNDRLLVSYTRPQLSRFFTVLYSIPNPGACPSYHPQECKPNLEHYVLECYRVGRTLPESNLKIESLEDMLGWEIEQRAIPIEAKNKRSYNIKTVINRLPSHVTTIQESFPLKLGRKGMTSFLRVSKLIEDGDIAETTLTKMVTYLSKLQALGLQSGYFKDPTSPDYKDLAVLVTYMESLLKLETDTSWEGEL